MLRRIAYLSSIGFIMALLVISFSIEHVSGAMGGIGLRPPFNGTYRLTSFFDHYYPQYASDPDGLVTIYTGEKVANCSPHCYRGHPGYDWSMATGTQVLAAADGIVRERTQSNTGYGWRIVIEHKSGHRTLYAHLSGFNVTLNQPVVAGDIIGWSGSTGTDASHLHFGVYRGPVTSDEQYATDPLGWRGSSPDPLLNYPAPGQGHTASCLWRSLDQDPISCADTIVEDGAQGSIIHGAWSVSQVGNGYHTYYRLNTAPNDYTVSAVWNATSTVSGMSQASAFIPEVYHSTQHVTYTVWSITGWQSRVVNQSAYTNAWVSLGTYNIPLGQAQVGMFAHTDEPVGTKWVAADAIKFRSYRNFLPVALKNYCSPRYGELITNGYFNTGDNMGWATSRSNGPDPIVQPYAGSDYGAWLGRYNSNQDQMYQSVCPATPLGYATLGFNWWMSTQEGNTKSYDFLYVRVRDAEGNLLETLKTITNLNLREQWVWESSDLRAYAGQTIRISFEATTDGTLPTNFWIDSVSLYTSP